MQFSRFPVLPGSAEAQVICCGVVKRLLIAYFIGNISAKNIKIRSHVSKGYSKPKVGRCLRHGVLLADRWMKIKLECEPMPSLMVAMPNIGGALCSTPQSLADAHY